MDPVAANAAAGRGNKVIGVALGVLLLAGAGVVAWWLGQRAPVEAPAATAVTPVPAEAPAAAPPAATATPAATAAAPAAADANIDAIRADLQRRLDAIALAYEQGDARAADAALLPNHAVVRPDGELLDRATLLATWAEEWQTLANRDLTFYVESVTVDGAKTTAEWTILLTADIEADPPGHMMISGRQQGTFAATAAGLQLDGPIAYTAFERTYNGFPWPQDEPPR